MVVQEPTGDKSLTEISAWFKDRFADGLKAGMTVHRYTMYPVTAELLLYEGWRRQPEKAGPPRWQHGA